ncbi:MAG: hypothetical protein K2I10_01480, partial [Lachnospiraceae bacterium]|nr:hypothetical protein [Lachnospiraceae bacterium]
SSRCQVSVGQHGYHILFSECRQQSTFFLFCDTGIKSADSKKTATELSLDLVKELQSEIMQLA